MLRCSTLSAGTDRGLRRTTKISGPAPPFGPSAARGAPRKGKLQRGAAGLVERPEGGEEGILSLTPRDTRSAGPGASLTREIRKLRQIKQPQPRDTASLHGRVVACQATTYSSSASLTRYTRSPMVTSRLASPNREPRERIRGLENGKEGVAITAPSV